MEDYVVMLAVGFVLGGFFTMAWFEAAISGGRRE